MVDNLTATVRSALEGAQQAHHQAFLDQDGHDPEWPLWYADHLLSELRQLLSAEFSQSELVYLLLTATYRQQSQAPGQGWAEFTASFLVRRYGLD